MNWRTVLLAALMVMPTLIASSAARAELVLSQVIVDLHPDKPPREDIEVSNLGTERMYVTAEPSEIIHAGRETEERKSASDPEAAGLLVSPQRLVLEPGERRTIRVALVGPRPGSDRVYRIAIKPVTGPVTADVSAIKVLVGYDALVLSRPSHFTGSIVSERAGKTLILHNTGNTAQELFDGRQCDPHGGACHALPSKRLYPGAKWRVDLTYDTSVHYAAANGSSIENRAF